MSELVPFVVIGLASGSLYGLAGLGLVLTYRTSGIFNFAHGAIAAAVWVSADLRDEWRKLDELADTLREVDLRGAPVDVTEARSVEDGDVSAARRQARLRVSEG